MHYWKGVNTLKGKHTFRYHDKSGEFVIAEAMAKLGKAGKYKITRIYKSQYGILFDFEVFE